ncbi:MAG TPA: HlyD family secretion protein [Candidatus Didemnitutus sp.]|nr:HlyD family secretion protein [Candidatus Didemnitutus sp.]
MSEPGNAVSSSRPELRQGAGPRRNSRSTPAEEPGGTPPGKSEPRDRGDDRPKPPPWYRRPLWVGGLFVLVAAAAIGGTLWWRHARRFETTDDAGIDVIPQVVSAQLPGRVQKVPVQENQDVTAGTVLVEIDDADFRARAEQARALGAQSAAQRLQAESQRGIFEAQREQARAGLVAAETAADNAVREFRRLGELRAENAGAVSQQQWDNADAARRTTAAQMTAAEKTVSAAEAQVGYAGSLIAAAEAAQTSAAAQLREAELNLSYMQVRAKVNGRIANLRVAPGNYVTPGMALMAVVPREVYVTANFKETQLTRMRPGQHADVRVDAYPDLDISGRVESVRPGTGDAFTLLPAENATGNWVKVVQRVPVRIRLDRLPDDPQRLGPGMSVEVKVEVR